MFDLKKTYYKVQPFSPPNILLLYFKITIMFGRNWFELMDLDDQILLGGSGGLYPGTPAPTFR